MPKRENSMISYDILEIIHNLSMKENLTSESDQIMKVMKNVDIFVHQRIISKSNV